MNTMADTLGRSIDYPVEVQLEAVTEDRNRLTTGFRFILALPHLLLVGGPVAGTLFWFGGSEGSSMDWGAGGVIGVAAGVAAMIAWFAIVFTGRHPNGLWEFAAYYLRWRIRAVAYIALLRDEYPPFGDGAYPAELRLTAPPEPRDRLTVAFRIFLAIPHIVAIWVLGFAWAVSTVVAWFSILFTGRYPRSLYGFAVGVFRWNMRLEAYLLLLRDEYPPFALE